LSIASGLQESFEWKQVTKAAGTGAVSGAAAFLAPPVPADAAFSWGNVAQNVAVEAGKQAVLNDGKINNVSGLLMAAASAGAIKGLGFKDANTAFNAYRNTVGAGLNLLESKVRGQGDNAMQWVSMATAAIFDAGKGVGLRTEITTDAGKMNWQYLAIHAVGAAIVADSRGGDAATSYLGNTIGSGVTARDARDGEIAQQQIAATRAQYGQDGTGDFIAADRQREEQELAERRTRAQYGQDGTGDVLSNHNGERLNMPVEPSGPTPEQSRDALRQMDRGASVAGNGYKAKAGDSISKIIGTSDPQAIGNFMRANNLTNDRIDIGRNYFVPEDRAAYGDASALGQATLGEGNERIERLAAERAAMAAMTDPNNPANWRSASAGYQAAQAGGVVWREGARYSTAAASLVSSASSDIDPTIGLDPQFGGWSGETPDLPLLARTAGGVVGVAKLGINTVEGAARVASNSILQIGDILTGGLNHDSPLMQRVWREQGALGGGLVRLVTDPVGVTTDAIERAADNYARARDLDAQGRKFDAAVINAEQTGSIAATLLGGAQTVRSVASTGAAGLRSMGAQDYAFVESKGLTGGPSLSQRGAVDLFDLEPIPSRSLAAQADEFVGPRKPENWDDLVSHPKAHAFSVHGGGVSEGAVVNRARTGVKPNGDVGPIPRMSSVFYSDDLLIQADNSIRNSGGLSNAIARQPGESVVRVLTDDVGDLGVNLGYGYVRPGHTGSKVFNATVEGPLQRIDNLRSAQGIYEFNPTIGKWETITVYPAPF
jgi:hypothetical protein